MSKPINVNFKSAYNSIYHKNRKDIEKKIDSLTKETPAKSGLFLTDDDEQLPIFGPVGGCEKVISRKKTKGRHSGARIVLTKDNYGSRATGLGGLGATKCEAIDIVAGQLSCEDYVYDSKTRSRSNFATDGARIYLTERGNINHYFATENTEPLTSMDSNMKSGIGIKADHTLVIGREKVRILSGLGKFSGGERLSNGYQPSKSVIEIGSIAEDNYQPAVRGENLVRHLQKINDYLTNVSIKIQDLEVKLAQHRAAMALHIHPAAGVGAVVTFPSPMTIADQLRSVPELLNSSTDAIMEEYNKSMDAWRSLGIPNAGIKGTKEDYILSNTVFIGR